MKQFINALLAFSLSVAAPAVFAATAITTTTTNGTVPGTSINYTITATGTARSVFSAGTTDSGVWSWAAGFPEFTGANTQTLTVNFSAPVAINKLVIIVSSITSPNNFTLSVSGGTATTNDFDISDETSVMSQSYGITYNGSTGVFTPTNSNQTLFLGSTSTNTITQFSVTGNNGGDGYNLTFGTVDVIAPVSASVNNLWLSLLAVLSMLAVAGFIHRKPAKAIA